MEKVSDLIGSTRGIWLLAAIEAVYMIFGSVWGFDRYPFPFLTLVLSLIALQFSQIIIVVQNRQGAILETKQAAERQNVEKDLAVDAKSLELLQAVYDVVIKEKKKP